jgi:hypothetical protein
MAKLPWKPWHEVVKLRNNLRTGEFSLAVFAADLYQVALQKGQRPVYEKPEEFFARPRIFVVSFLQSAHSPKSENPPWQETAPWLFKSARGFISRSPDLSVLPSRL